MWWYAGRIKKFLFLSFLSGLLFGIVSIPKVGLLIAFNIGIIFAITAGGSASCILALLDYISLRPLYKKHGKIVLSVRQNKEILLDKPIETVASRCREILKNYKDFVESNSVNNRKTFEAKVGLTFWSFGEKITVSLESANNNKTKVYIESRPVYKLTLVDYGKNFKNVKKIEEILTT